MNFLRIMGGCFLVAGAAVFVTVPILRIMGGAWIFTGVLLLTIGQFAAKGAAHRKQLLATGKPGRATILHVTDTGVTINNSPRVRIQARIEVAGEPAIEAKTAMMVSRLSVPRAGEVYAVRFDPKNPNDFILTGSSSEPGSSGGSAGRGVGSGEVDDTIAALERLTALRDRGALTPTEFEAQKRKLLGES
jgi:hypothetical protein